MSISPYSLASEFTAPADELALIAALADDHAKYFECIDLLDAQVFTEHQSLFETVAVAIEDQTPLPSLPPDVVRVTDPIATSQLLADLYQRRLLATLLQEALVDLRGDGQAKDLSVKLEQGVARIQHAVREYRMGALTAATDLFADMIALARERHQRHLEGDGNTVAGISCGLPSLDKLLSGYQAGLHLIAGEPGVGKTSLVLRMAAAMAAQGVPVLFVTFEEPSLKVSGKALCGNAGLSYSRYADGYGNPDDLDIAVRQHSRGLERLFIIEGSSELTVTRVKAKAIQIMRRCNSISICVVVDYLQRMASATKQFTDFRHIVGGLAADFRELSLRLNCPVILISSQNRQAQGQPTMMSLKESGDLEYASDSIAVAVESKERFSATGRVVELNLLKNRYGDRGKVNLLFDPATGTFTEFDAQSPFT